MKYEFTVKGHPNVLATHKTTLEFTKDLYLTKAGDCIVGISAYFELDKIKQFLNRNKVRIKIKIDDIEEIITAVPNPGFDDEKEIVVRLGNFTSERTFAVNADKSASMLSRSLIHKLKNPETIAKITIE